jgi:hypothetical protein
MKVAKVREHYAAQSAKLSEVTRALAIAGLAVVWIFRSEAGRIPLLLFVPAGMFVLALAADLLQYMIAAWNWQTQANLVQRSDEGDEHKVPTSVNRWPERLHMVKAPLVLAGLAALILFVGLTLAGVLPAGEQPAPKPAGCCCERPKAATAP